MSENQQQAPVNPLLQRIKLPGETFTLPSGGLFYDDSVLDPSVENAEIHVHPMTAIDEIVMKTPDLLFSGKAVKQVFERCIPQVLNAEALLAKDIDFLLTCLRKISYGDEMSVQYRHDCKDAKTHSYTIDITTFIRNSKRIDPTSLTKNFTVTLDNDQVVNLQPVTFKEFVQLMQTINKERDADVSPEELRDTMIETMSDVIVDVDGVTDKAFIKEWLEGIPPKYTAKINEKLDKSSDWGTDFNVTVQCKDCGKEAKFQAPMNPLSFFT